MDTNATQVQGVPPGLTAEPVQQNSQKVSGVPAGLSAEPINQPQTAVQPQKTIQTPEQHPPVQGVPTGVRPEILKPWEMNPKQPQATMQARNPSLYERANIAFRNGDTGRTLANNWADLERMGGNFWQSTGTPMVASDEKSYEELVKKQNEFIDKYVPTKVGKGAAKGTLQFGEEMTSSRQVALMLLTFGESALANTAIKAGLPKLVPAARVVGKLIQAEFISQMAEGGYTNTRDAIKSAMSGDWETASQQAVGGLANILMARAGINHADATERVSADLNSKAVETQGAKFDKLSPEKQAEVIDATVQSSPEYKEAIADIDARNAKTAQDIRENRARKLAHYEGLAFDQAWNPDASKRAVEMIRGKRAAEAQERVQRSVIDAHKQNILDAIKKRDDEIRDLQEKRRQGINAGRLERGQKAAEERAPIIQSAAQIAEGRKQTAEERNNLHTQPYPEEMWRPVESHVDENGHVSYPANYIDQKARIGVVTDGRQHSVYRMAGNRVEWLDQSGIFVPEPTDLYQTDNAEVADTLARIGAASTTADTLAEQDNANEDHIKDSNELDEVRKSLVAGDVTPDEARRKAGIAETPEVKDEYGAARDGQLGGPFAEDSPARFASKFENDLRESGASDEEIKATMEALPEITRTQTEQYLHHVQKSGDYILSKKGVRWTLDGNGMLHPDNGGTAVPLLKRGLYSSQAMRLASSGKIGYGAESFENARDRREWEKNGQDALNNADAILAAPYGYGVAPEDEREGRRAAYERRNGGKGIQPPPNAAEPESVPARGNYTQEPQFANLLLALENAPHADVTKYMRDPARTIAAFVKAAEKAGVNPEALVRMKLMQSDDPTVAAIAGLNPGDQIKPKGAAEGKWTVVERGGNLSLQYGDISVPLDRINPSDTVKRIVRNGDVSGLGDPAKTPEYQPPVSETYKKDLAAEVKERMGGKEIDAKPQTEKQQKAQVEAAERRTDATVSLATQELIKAQNPVTTDVEQALDNVDQAEKGIKLAEEAYAQEAKTKSQSTPDTQFPQRSPVGIGYRGAAGSVVQNNREFAFHYELVPVRSATASHKWEGNVLVINDAFPDTLQPRTISEAESRQNAMRAQVGTYDIRQLTDKTISAATGTIITDTGGQIVSGNTRYNIYLKHLENLKAISDPEEREARLNSQRAVVTQWATDSGISKMPGSDPLEYIVARVLDNPIETNREAADLGRLFNKKIGVEITKSAKGISYSKSLDPETLDRIGIKVEEKDGIVPAMESDPDFFRDLVVSKFGVVPEEYADWFNTDERGNPTSLNESGRDQFIKALLGTVVKDTSVLNKIEGKTPYRALSRALNYILKMKAIPNRDIADKVLEAVQAAADTQGVNPELHTSKDVWRATYQPQQADLLGMEAEAIPEPDRIVEAIWRALHASDVASPRVFNDRLKRFLGEETSENWLTGATTVETEQPHEAFNRAFAKELKAVAFARGDGEDALTKDQYDALLRNHPEPSKKEPQTEQPKIEEPAAEVVPRGIEPPPTAKESHTAEHVLAAEKAEKGYITPDQLKEFLRNSPATKAHVPELYRTAQLMAEYVYDVDPPEGVDRKNALDWILRERVARIESGNLKNVRGEYSDPYLEKDLGTRIMKLHKAADGTTFIHEFAHVIFPFLSNEDLKAIDSIGQRRVWDGNPASLKGETYVALSEKLGHGLERFLRDQNPRDFKDNVGTVLAKVKGIFRKVYLSFRKDPLAPYTLDSDSVEMFDKMFHIEGSDVPDEWREVVKKARAEEKKIARPEEAVHPEIRVARSLGATGITDAVDGKVVDQIGDRVDPKKPIVVFTFDSMDVAKAAVGQMLESNSPFLGAELIEREDGTGAVRVNTKNKVTKTILRQDLPEKHPGLRLEDLEKRLAETPTLMLAKRKLLELQISNLKNKIRADYGVEERKQEPIAEAAQKAVEEAKNGEKANSRRTANDGVPRIPQPPRVGGIPKPPNTGRIERPVAGGRNAGIVGRTSEAPISLENVKPVSLEPMANLRGTPVGLTKFGTFTEKGWADRLQKGGLPETLPPPTWELDPKTAAQLIYPGQKEIVQTALSASQQGDGFAIVSPPGTGKTYLSSAIAAEFLKQNPDANILYISKNRNLYDKFRRVAKKTFGVDVSDEPLSEKSKNGVYVTSYMGTLNNDIYKNKHWDLVLADEAGEARRFYDPNTQQGDMLRKIMANADKGGYLSATPFHSPSEYGYLDKLNMWPKGRYGRWLAENFKHRVVNGEVVAELDPAKQAKLREQLIARGQLIPQNISYEGYTAHFGVVPVTHDMERGLNRIRIGFDRARQRFEAMGKKGLARKVSAFEAVYTKNFLERSRMPQAIEIAKRAIDQGWRVLVFSEHTSDDLFRRERMEGEDPSTYQQLDDAMGGGLSKIIPPYAGVYGELDAAFPGQVGDYSGRGNTNAAREKARTDFLKGDLRMLYASYAGGGIGVDMHDADFPELGIKGGDKPIVAIYLGPPYSGVLLEQAMGRPWRFGVKSNVHAVFLATDAEPEIRLMQTKIGPRMRALRAAVVGEKDSLADVMGSYTNDQKVRERQEQLAYSQGNEVKLNATDLVARKGRHVGIQSWDHIQFPSAEDAKHKGMKYGDEVTGGDWSTLYQDTQSLWKQGPPTPEKIEGDKTIDALAQSVMNGEVPLQNLDPADRTAEVGAASAMAADAVALDAGRDPESVVKNTMKWGLKIPKRMDVRFEKTKQGKGPFARTVERAVWTFPEGKEPRNAPVGTEDEDEPMDRHTRYFGWGSMKGGIESIARQAGTPEIGLNLTRTIGSWQRDVDMMQSQFRWYARENFEHNGLDWKKQSVVAEVMAVAERQKTSADPAINKASEAMRDWFRSAAEYAVKEGVKKKNADGKWVPFKPMEDYWTHIIDWKAELEYKDPKTGEMKRTTLRDAMKRTFPEDARNALMAKMASSAKWSDGQPVSIGELDRYLRRNYRKGTPLQPNVQTERTINFPIVRKDFDVLDNYAGQIARAISTERYFGSDRGKLLTEISKIPSTNGRRDITLMFDSMLSPQELSQRWLAFSNAMTAFTALSKMSLSFAKVPSHATHMFYALHGDVRPMIKGMADILLHSKQAYDDAVFMGTLARQVDFTGVTDTERKGPSHLMFEVTGFNSAYKMGRVWTSLAAKHWMEDYAMRGLKKGGQSAVEVRRMLKNTMLIGDSAVDRAMQTGQFTPEDIQRAQVAFANEVMLTDNPMEMPAWARIHIGRETPGYIANLSRAMRLTYSMASFTVKTRAFLRKHIVDEVFRYHNPKMLALFAAIEPIIGTSVWTAGAGAKSVIQRGLENVSGQQHKKNALDREKDEFEAALYGKNGPKKLAEDVELYVDLMTAGIAQEQIKLLGDMLLNIAANPKKAKQEASFYAGDIFESVVGPIWTSTIVHPLEWMKREVDIMAGGKSHKGKRTLQNTEKTVFGEFPVSSNIPQITRLTKPPR